MINNRAQLRASLRLTAWLRCHHGIQLSNAIGHAESLSSPYHHEGVQQLKRQTHEDFQPATMERYRGRLRSKNC